MGVFSDLKILYHLAVRPVRGTEHAERLENFYGGQAGDYDSFRKRLLKGREELLRSIDVPEGGVWVDMGGGTGANLEFLPQGAIQKLKKIYVVDLAESLLTVARHRAERHGWNNIETVRADATTWVPEEKTVDVITFSYSLTMIPDWFAAIDHADELLRLGGKIGVVDFYLARKFPNSGRKKHGFATRSFWPVWFSCDNVFPSPDHLPYLERRFATATLDESAARVPYHPFFWWKMPYYRYIGVKK